MTYLVCASTLPKNFKGSGPGGEDEIHVDVANDVGAHE